MALKFLILGFLGLLSVASPPVFAGLVMVALISVTVCNLDIGMERLSKMLTEKRSKRPLKIPCNFLAIGLLFTAAFTLAGFAWGVNPHFAGESMEILRVCLSIGLQFGSLLILVGSMVKFVKLVD